LNTNGLADDWAADPGLKPAKSLCWRENFPCDGEVRPNRKKRQWKTMKLYHLENHRWAEVLQQLILLKTKKKSTEGLIDV